ncbi:MAG: hypothetical protein ACRDQZ_13385, partial [Mycobacteriales bacterium]
MTPKALRSRVSAHRTGLIVIGVVSVAIAASSAALAGRLLAASDDPVSQAVTSQATQLVAYRTSWG